MADSSILTRHLWLLNLVDTPQICIIEDTICSADNSARHGQNQEKKKIPTTELNIFLSEKNSDGK